MTTRIKADGATWRAEVADESGERLVLFFCVSTDQRPYRVVRADGAGTAGTESLDEMPEEALRALFDASRSMGIPQDYPTYGP